MLTNSNITVYNRKKVHRNYVWVRTHIFGVCFHGEEKIMAGDRDFTPADKYIIRIPENVVCDKKFVDNHTYKALSTEETENCYTLQKGDIIVKGTVEIDIDSPAQLLDLYDALTVISVTDNRRKGAYTSHIKVVCGYKHNSTF